MYAESNHPFLSEYRHLIVSVTFQHSEHELCFNSIKIIDFTSVKVIFAEAEVQEDKLVMRSELQGRLLNISFLINYSPGASGDNTPLSEYS